MKLNVSKFMFTVSPAPLPRVIVSKLLLGLVQVAMISSTNRADRTLTYAGSTTKDNVTTTIVGSEDASTEKT